MKILVFFFGFVLLFLIAFNSIAQPANDNFASATVITHSSNNCSANAAYTTVNATADGLTGSCWENGPNYTVWFTFVATSANVTLDLKVGGAEGTMQHPNMALWQSNGTTELKCVRRVDATTDVQISSSSLTIGNTYYVSVDNFVGLGYRGTFTFCIDNTVTYDYIAGAIELTNLNNWCSANGAFTTLNATPDGLIGSCWENGPNYTRWFKFTALSNIVTIQMKVAGAEGTLQHPNMALWQSDATTQVACVRRVDATTDVSISSAALTVGNTYYISCDNYVGLGYRGTFTLCINNIDETYYSRAGGAWNTPNTWSTIAIDGVPAADYPKVGDIVYVQGRTIAITGNEVAAEVNVNASPISNTDLSLSGGSLNVAGKFNVTNLGNNFNVNLTFSNTSLFINDDFTINRNGGTAIISALANNSSITVNKNFNIYSVAGTGDNSVTIALLSTFTVNNQTILSNTGGPKTILTVDNSTATIKENLSFVASANNRVELDVSGGSNLYLNRNIVRGSPAYGILLSTGSSTVRYNSSVYQQLVASSNGSGTGDVFTYENLVFNNTHVTIPQLTMSGMATVNGNLTLTSGVVLTTSTNILNLKNATATSIGSSGSYIDGPMTYEIATNAAGTTRNLPVGKSGSYRPAVLVVTHSDNASVTYTAEHFSSSAVSLGYTLAPTTDKVSNVRYWNVTRQAVANLTTAQIRLYYGNGTSDGVTDFANLTVVKNVGAGTAWVDVGGTATGNGTGSILSGAFSSFSNITLANRNGGTNPLPIELKDFEGHFDGRLVQLNWTTASELNNDYFSVQRSKDGAEFIEVAVVSGAGTKTSESFYRVVDHRPLIGTGYYRLKQTDIDGLSAYSKVIKVESHPISKFEILVYPNPTLDGEFLVNLNRFEAKEEVRISIIDVLGRVKYMEILEADESGYLLIPMHLNETGVYFISVATMRGILTTKVIMK